MFQRPSSFLKKEFDVPLHERSAAIFRLESPSGIKTPFQNCWSTLLSY